MKKKKHISPTNVLGIFFSFAFYSTYWLVYPVLIATRKFDAFSISLLCIGIILLILALVFSILTMLNKKMRCGDEYTTKILHKSAYHCLKLLLFVITFTFLVIQIVKIAKIGIYGDINEFLNAKTILSIIAGIQIIATFLFSLLVYVFSKRGGL